MAQYGYGQTRKGLYGPVWNGKETYARVAAGTTAAAITIPAGAIGMLVSTTLTVLVWIAPSAIDQGGARVPNTNPPVWFPFDRSSWVPAFWISAASATTAEIIFFYD